MMLFPESKYKFVVETPYGRGVVLRTRHPEDDIVVREIDLSDLRQHRVSGSRKCFMLFSPSDYPPAKPQLGDEVITLFGRGKVIEERYHQMVVVRISSWRLARRAVVSCSLSADALRVVKPPSVSEMNVHEKIEYAQELKGEAADRFVARNYADALKIYSEAIDTVRYVQHTTGSSNEIRADLLVVMITCCNNAGTCSLLLKRWDGAYKFGKNALVLLDALYMKRRESKILSLLYKEGLSEAKIFGTWKVKSLFLVARGLSERHETRQALAGVKQAIEIIEGYKRRSTSMYQQLHAQEKEARKMLSNLRQKLNAEKKKEKERAIAMFGGSANHRQGDAVAKNEETCLIESRAEKSDQRSIMTSSIPAEHAINCEESTNSRTMEDAVPPKSVSFSDGSVPGHVDDEEGTSFLEEHKEALLLLAVTGLGTAVALHFMNRRS
eukprot:scaffold5517_cov135-Cylindrotheca_fusiformis.AAC.10